MGGSQGHTTALALTPCTSYDEDFNHEPCQRKGYKAHWAVSTGGSSPAPYSYMLTLFSPAPHYPHTLNVTLALLPY